MQLRFVAEDLGEDQYVEAAIDDVQILPNGTSAKGIVAAPSALRLAPPSPNPFRSASAIVFELPRAGDAWVEVYDVSGRRVVELLRGERVAAGSHRLRWDGRDHAGRAVAGGVYFVKVSSSGATETRKITLLR